MEDIFSAMMPLLAVMAVIAGAYFTTRWMGRHHNAYSSGRSIQVLERVMLARDTYLALVRVGDKTHLASIASGKVELLREVDPQELKGVEGKRPGNDFFGALTKAMGKGRQTPSQPDNDEGQDGAMT